ncbi:MAG TPA: Holliday junction resolvase RuvX [Elusimicrobia bacterium]|nr:Holliday junction resolvase RuvX [Elusimicrobiota bacterium]
MNLTPFLRYFQKEKENILSILAIDYGKKRIGLAVTSTFIPTALKSIVVENTEKVFLDISDVIKENEVTEVVVGLPLNMDNTESLMTEETRKFAAEIEKRFKLKTTMVNEQLTSKEAEEKLAITEKNWKKRKNKIDSVAACIILESFLKQKNNEEKQT